MSQAPSTLFTIIIIITHHLSSEAVRALYITQNHPHTHIHI